MVARPHKSPQLLVLTSLLSLAYSSTWHRTDMRNQEDAAETSETDFQATDVITDINFSWMTPSRRSQGPRSEDTQAHVWRTEAPCQQPCEGAILESDPHSSEASRWPQSHKRPHSRITQLSAPPPKILTHRNHEKATCLKPGLGENLENELSYQQKKMIDQGRNTTFGQWVNTQVR